MPGRVAQSVARLTREPEIIVDCDLRCILSHRKCLDSGCRVECFVT